MQNDLMEISALSFQKTARQAVMRCNDFTENFGLSLTAKEAADLVAARAASLKACGRIEFDGGVIEKLIRAFCDSPFISPDNYAATLHELIECFYFYKNDTLDLCSDDEIIDFMEESFNGVCQGSVDLLREREMEKLAVFLRYKSARGPGKNK